MNYDNEIPFKSFDLLLIDAEVRLFKILLKKLSHQLASKTGIFYGKRSLPHARAQDSFTANSKKYIHFGEAFKCMSLPITVISKNSFYIG